MKFQLLIDPNGQQLLITPENVSEQRILEVMAPAKPVRSDEDPERTASVTAEWSNDRSVDKKLLALKVRI